ncbi:MAG: replication initiator [Streptosporangiaceae bacterium]
MWESAADTATITWAGLHQAERQHATTGGCTHPIQLRGRIDAIDLGTGELAPVYDSATEPGGVLLTACGNRRETVCPSCSAVYKRDARQLVRAGLSGGKGIPEAITGHPCVFATLTAPSFGPVHARRMRGTTVLPCRPRRDASARRCPHGRDISCAKRHQPGDPRLGHPMCADCYDYTAAVLFNAHAADLWRRFTTYLPRHFARLTGLSLKQLRELVAIRYVKVAEYQARGAVHFHAIIRLDGVTIRDEIIRTSRGTKVRRVIVDEGPDNDYRPPPPGFTAAMLCDAITQAAKAVAYTTDPAPGCPPVTLRFGAQTEPRAIRHSPGLPGTGHALGVQAVANYIAKYATKALDAPGIPDQPIRSALDLENLRCSAHYRQMILTAWRLGGGKLGPTHSRLCKWAHMLGYGGHFLTKSRRYSVTFGQLRAARTQHRKQQRHPGGEHDPWGRPLDEHLVLVISTWTYTGTGYTTTPGADLAAASAARARAYDPAVHAA